MSGAISATTAITNTEANLRRQMRPIIAFEVDDEAVEAAWEEAGGYWYTVPLENGSGHSAESRGADWPTVMPLTVELIRQIATLPQVEEYHYSVTAAFAFTEFIEYLPTGAESTTEGSMSCFWDRENDICFEESMVNNAKTIMLRGTSNNEPLEMHEGLIELVSGSSFENHHQDQPSTTYPALVSSGFAEVNGFQIGSTFILESRIVRRISVDSWEDFFFDQMEYEFEIVGLFDVVPFETDDEWFEAQRQRELANRVFTTNAATEAIQIFEFERSVAAAFEADEELWFDPETWNFEMETGIMLTDPLELEAFAEAVSNYLPEFWIINDLTTSFDQISTSMETLNDIADGILLASIGTTVLILSLLIMLFLRDRRHEIGIYLALGEKKSTIILQVLFEVLTTALIGITVTIFVGNAIAANLSREMIRTELAQPAEVSTWGRSHWVEGREDLGFGGHLSPEEMVDAFNTSLNGNAIVLLYVVGLGTVVVSTLIPIFYVIKLEPKKLLL